MKHWEGLPQKVTPAELMCEVYVFCAVKSSLCCLFILYAPPPFFYATVRSAAR